MPAPRSFEALHQPATCTVTPCRSCSDAAAGAKLAGVEERFKVALDGPLCLAFGEALRKSWHEGQRAQHTTAPCPSHKTSGHAIHAIIPPGGIELSRAHHREPMLQRLSRMEGHVHAIREMLAADRDCPEILIQLAAVRGALDAVARMVFEDHLDNCIMDAVETGQAELKIAEIKAAFARYFLP